MLVKEQARHTISPLPQSFAALMEMYEYNYILVRLLLGDVRRLEDRQVLHAGTCLPLQVQVKERSRHTTTLMLTYCFNNKRRRQRTGPDLLVRICHDARQAEVVQHRCHMPSRDADETVDGMLLCRWRMNRFLYKWINYLRKQNYGVCYNS
ncbi:MAG TPA: DUF1249 domain-containing protein [Thiolinea sp.]|nr:DUF1249 domain-containing protein [Thiolinea sp.]